MAGSSFMSTDVIVHHIKFNYQKWNHLSVGSYVRSRSFSSGGYEWCIKYFPKGSNNEHNGMYASLYLELQSKSMAVSVTFEYFLLDQNGRPNTSGRTLKASHIFQVCYESFGSENFIDDDTLRSFYINTEGCFVLTCTIQMDDESCKELPKNPSIDFSQFDMHKDFMNILEKEEMSDVTFKVEEETIAAHKLFLAARSPVFKAELFGSMSESVSNMKSIMIKDMHPDVFKSLLHFIYTDSIPKIDDKKAATVMAQHLLVAADRYAVEKLKLVCQDKLCEEISLDTVASLLALAHQHNCIELKSACLKFVAVPMNRSDLALNEEYLKLISGSPSLLAEIRAKVAETSSSV